MWLNCLILLKGWNEVIKRNGRKVWISGLVFGILDNEFCYTGWSGDIKNLKY